MKLWIEEFYVTDWVRGKCSCGGRHLFVLSWLWSLFWSVSWWWQLYPSYISVLNLFSLFFIIWIKFDFLLNNPVSINDTRVFKANIMFNFDVEIFFHHLVALHTFWKGIVQSIFTLIIFMYGQFIKVYWRMSISNSHGVKFKLDLRTNLFQQRENNTGVFLCVLISNFIHLAQVFQVE